MASTGSIFPFLLAAILVIVVPGPATFYVIGKAHLSPRQACLGAIGIVSGDLVLILASGLGFASLVARWPLLLLAVKLGGAAYVALLGWELVKPSSCPREGRGSTTHEERGGGLGIAKGLLITLTNPKPILFFAAFFPMFIRAGTASILREFLVLGFYFEVLNICYFSALILVVARLRHWPIFDRFLGGGFKAVSGIGMFCCSAFIFMALFF